MRTLLLLALLLPLAACGGDSYDCQPICKDTGLSNSMVLGSDKMFSIGADSQEAAEDSCLDDAMNTADVCMPGWTVTRCSCSSK